MVKANNIGPSKGVTSLQQKEAQQVKQDIAKGPKGKITAQDAARIASQAGFKRLGAKKRKGFNVGSSADQENPLPEDELDLEAWSQEGLESAQGSLTLAGSQLGDIAKAGAEGVSMGAALVGGTYLPTEEDIAEMEDLAERKPTPIPLMEEVSNSVNQLFGIELNEDVPVGHRVLATGLLVAGEQDAVEVENGQLNEGSLAGGVEKVTKRGNQAVDDAGRMNKGIDQEINRNRTFMYRR